MKLIEYIKYIPKGTFNYKRYKRNYHCKFNRDIDIFLEYMAQLPYIKVVTAPLVILIMLIEFLPIVAVVMSEHAIDKVKELRK